MISLCILGNNFLVALYLEIIIFLQCIYANFIHLFIYSQKFLI